MAGNEGKKVNGDEGSSEQIEGELVHQIRRSTPSSPPSPPSPPSPDSYGCLEEDELTIPAVNLFEEPRKRGPRLYDLVSKEETAAAYVYKMDKTWLPAGEVSVEIRRGHALWVIGEGDEPVKVELPRNSKMRVREATASMSPEGVLTVVIPKMQRPRKWSEFMDSVFLWFETVHVGISS